MSAITPQYHTIKELLQSRSFGIDEYQREYKWERKNVEELIADLLGKFESSYRPGDQLKTATNYAEYFLGSIIVTNRNGKSYLVDGQQRVTSLTLLLIYLYREAKVQGLAVASTIEPLIFSDDFGDKSFNLAIPERIPVIQALFNGEHYNADGKEESIQTIIARYQDIETIDLAGELGEALPNFIYWLINRVGLIEISTSNDSHAYSIFETMNDRGKPLSPVDMLKAYLLTPILEEEQRANANRLWKLTMHSLTAWGEDPDPERDSTFMKAWLRAKYANTIRERKAGSVDKDWELIGSTFHRWLRDNERRIGAGDAANNLRLMTEEIPFFARAYRQILDASQSYMEGLEPVFYNAHNEFTWQATVLLAPLQVGDDDAIVRRKLAATATYLDIWIMRRTSNYIRVGYSGVSYAMWLLAKDIRGLSLNELIDMLKKKLDDDATTFQGSQSPQRGGVRELGLNQFSRRYIYHLLARITAYVDVGAGRPDMFDKLIDRRIKNAMDIEHVWAQDYSYYQNQFSDRQQFETWRDHVAGLLLLPADVNRSLQDKPFEQKAPHYAKENFYAKSLTSSAYIHQPQFSQFLRNEGLTFKPYERFGREEQTERRELVLELAKRVWSPNRLEGYRL